MVIVANPRKLHAISRNERKCDRRDARMPARPWQTRWLTARTCGSNPAAAVVMVDDVTRRAVRKPCSDRATQEWFLPVDGSF
jgi:hypothetical protein